MVQENTYSVLDSHRDRVSTVELWDNGIVYIRIDDNTEVGLDDSKAQHSFLLSKFDGKNKLRILVEPGMYTSITKEAREYSQRPESNLMNLANAVIVKSLAQRLVINFMINVLQRNAMKMRIFDSKEKAIEWLLSRTNK